MSLIGRIYNQSFERSPAGTLAVTNGILSGIADMVAQASQIGLAYRSAKGKKNDDINAARIPSYDPLRTARFLAFGTMMGPLLARWNHFLELKFPLRPPTTKSGVSLTALAKRVGSDQLFMAPLGLAIFLGSMGVMEGHSNEAIKKKYNDLFRPAILANWTVWPFIQVVNFRFMPLPYRVPFQASCGVFWTLYLSLLNSSKTVTAEEAAADLKQAADKAATKMVQAAHS